MGKENYINAERRRGDEYVRIALTQYKRSLQLYGIPVKVRRIKENSELDDRRRRYLNTYGQYTYNDQSSDSLDSYDTFDTELIFNKTNLLDVWNRQGEEVEIYTVENELRAGDVVIYQYVNREFSFKVKSHQTLDNLYYTYTLIGIKDNELEDEDADT